jgi:hypothetical protein
MNYNQWIAKNHPIHISTYMKLSYKIKTLNREQKNKISQGMNINV